MLGKYWVPSREYLVTLIEDNMIRIGLSNDYNVIVDATNLNENTIKRLEKTARLTKSEIKFITLKAGVTRSFIQVLWRTLLGGKFISYKVIKGFYNRYRKVK